MCGTLAREGTVHSDGFGKTKSYSDGKIVTNIEDLFFEFLRVADKIRPKTIIAENVEGLTVGFAQDDNGLSGTSKLETETMYAKYAFGSFTVGVQESEQSQEGATTSDGDFSAVGITYQVSDDLTIGYHASEREFGDQTQDQENKNLSISYTTGGVTVSVAYVSMDNVGGSTASRDDIDGYAIDLGFAF